MSSLLEMLGGLADPRKPRGKRHELVFTLACAVVAVLAGAANYRQIGSQAADLPQSLLAKLGAKWNWFRWRYDWPSESTVRRVLQDIDAYALIAPSVLRAVFGTGLYLTMVGLLGVGLGWIIRSTAGAIATLFGLLMVLPLLAQALPPSWADHINPYLPSDAGQQLLVVVHWNTTMLAPWTGFGVFCLYAAVVIAVAAVLLKRRDA